VAVAYPDLHKDLLEGKAVMMGCPKFDDIDAYAAKFAEVFANAKLRSVTTVTMEVPCCSSLPNVVAKAMKDAQVSVPHKQMVISTRGKILEQTGP
jgi:hypothetical protein